MVEHVSIKVINEKLVSVFINTQKEDRLLLHRYVKCYTFKSDVFPYDMRNDRVNSECIISIFMESPIHIVRSNKDDPLGIQTNSFI